MTRFNSAKVMPYSGGIVRTHRHRRIVQCREKIGPDVVDFCGGLAHGLDNVLDIQLCSLLIIRSNQLVMGLCSKSPAAHSLFTISIF